MKIRIFDARTEKLYGVMSDEGGKITFDPPDPEFEKMLVKSRNHNKDPMEFYRDWSNGWVSTRELT